MDRQGFNGGNWLVGLSDIERYAKEYVTGLIKDLKMPHVRLDNVELLKRDDKHGKVAEIRSIYSLSVYGGRSIVELPIPGSVGNVFQDMGRAPLLITFDGLLLGPNSMDTLKDLKEKFELGKPVDFSSDIGLINEIDKVVIEKFNVHFEGGINMTVRYSMVLKEYLASEKDKTKKEPPSLVDKAVAAVTGKIAKAALDKLAV
jgi:hypothetical protein